MTENKRIKIQLAALNPYIQTNMVENVSKELQGKDFILWGNDNRYPDFLFDLYTNCTTLQSVINGTADFIVGDDITCNVPRFQTKVNKKGETIKDIIDRIIVDYLIFGGFAIQVLRDFNGNVSEIYWLDFAKVRSDKKNEVFFYSDDWTRSYGRVKYITYPKFKEGDSNPASIYYYKGTKTRDVYPTPLYNGAIKSCMVQTKIDEFQLNEISNNFLSSKIINFNSGIPDDDLKNEIERNINEKFSGSENVGRILVSFNENKDSETTITDLATDDFADRYTNLANRSVSQIYAAFRATPNLFGLPSENLGFNNQEYESSFKLYNRTVVRPIQNIIVDCMDKIMGMVGSITIVPFSLEDNITNEEKEVTNE